MLRGWFKMNRDIIKRAIFSDAELLRLYIYLKADAYYEPFEKLIDGQIVVLQPGQGTCGHRQLASALGANPSTTYKRLQKLKDLGFISLKPYKEMSVYTVIDWEMDSDKKVNTKETPSAQQNQGLTGSEDSESKRCGIKNETPTQPLKEGRRKRNTYSSTAKDVVGYLKAILVSKGVTLARDWHLKSLPVAEELLKNVPQETLIGCMDWGFADQYWGSRIDSMSTIRNILPKYQLQLTSKQQPPGGLQIAPKGWTVM